jgi:hypothetical protein
MVHFPIGDLDFINADARTFEYSFGNKNPGIDIFMDALKLFVMQVYVERFPEKYSLDVY